MACALINSAHHHSSPNLTSNGGYGSVPGSSSMHELAAIVVPNELKSLIRLIMRIFYNFELYLCIEMLLIYPCLKEEDLAELLRLDLKMVHQYLVNLKKEKFLNEKSIMETSADGKQSKHSYFYINYQMVVKVIKYKLDRIRIQIELDENQFTTRAQFKCTECGKTYSDLDTKDIFLTMRCILCGADVDEDTSALPKQSARNLMNKFNTQMAPIFELLRRVEHVRLAENILRPEPVDMSYVLERMKSSASGGPNGPGKAANGLNGKPATNKFDRWSGDKTRNTDLLSKTQISVNLDSGDSSAQAKRVAKELPSIITLNRRDEDLDNRDSILLNSVRQAADETINNTSVEPASTNFAKPNLNSSVVGQPTATGDPSSSQPQNLEVIIMQKLLKHEKKATNTSSADSPPTADSSSTSNSPKMVNSGANSAPVSSISITRKRPLDAIDGLAAFKQSNGAGSLSSPDFNRRTFDENDVFIKKRKLNNGESNHHHVSSVYLKRNHSDGSGSENSSETDELYYPSGGDEEDDYRDVPDEADEDDQFIPRVCVQSRPVRFDRVTPKLIGLMSQNEKDDYINICKQLYTEIYEI